MFFNSQSVLRREFSSVILPVTVFCRLATFASFLSITLSSDGYDKQTKFNIYSLVRLEFILYRVDLKFCQRNVRSFLIQFEIGCCYRPIFTFTQLIFVARI